jgi:hypothetical protein
MQTVIDTGVGFATQYFGFGNVLLTESQDSYTVEDPNIAHLRLGPRCKGRGGIQRNNRCCNPLILKRCAARGGYVGREYYENVF